MNKLENVKRIPASEWSGLSTKKQIDMARLYDKLVVTWQGDDELVVRHVSKEQTVDSNNAANA